MKHTTCDQDLDPRLVAAINRFGFRLLRELAGDAPAENLLISPAGLSAALAMTYNGASGETRRRWRRRCA